MSFSLLKWTDDSLMNRMIAMRVLVIGRIRMSSGYYQLGARMWVNHSLL